MAALLRQGARRIGGSVLQQAQAAVTSPAVAGERRRLVLRRMYSTEQGHGGIAREIQQKKDELYDLINEGENNVRTSTWTNVWLLQYLSGEVTPRPYNAKWRDLQEMRRTVSGIKSAGFFSLAFLVVYYRIHSNDKVSPAMMMKEEHEASEVETRSRLTGN